MNIMARLFNSSSSSISSSKSSINLLFNSDMFYVICIKRYKTSNDVPCSLYSVLFNLGTTFYELYIGIDTLSLMVNKMCISKI